METSISQEYICKKTNNKNERFLNMISLTVYHSEMNIPSYRKIAIFEFSSNISNSYKEMTTILSESPVCPRAPSGRYMPILLFQ